MKRPGTPNTSLACSLGPAVSSRPHSAFHGPRSRGFTLIELLMVVLVILLLSAMLFRVAALIGDRAQRARAVADIQNLQNVLNEYFAEYGTYPPIRFNPADPGACMLYEYENQQLQPGGFRRAMQDPDDPLSDMDLGYQYGLAAYLYKRDRGAQVIAYDRDLPRDEVAKEGWAHYLREVGTHGFPNYRINNHYPAEYHYSNDVLTVVDPWGNNYRYDSPPPYISYRLWSAGPDGNDNTPDDISNAAF